MPLGEGSNCPEARRAFTLLEVLLAMSIVSVLTAVAIPRFRSLIDTIEARSAAADAGAMLDAARHSAMARGARVVVDIDTARAIISMRAGTDTLRKRDERTTHGVRLRASRTSVTYAQLGMGFGVSNLTLIVSRGVAAETVTVSRLGRVRR